MTSLEKKNRELTVLLEVSRVLSSSFEIEKSLYQALKILSE
jgi:Nif-specific regulatory protein